MRVLFLVGVLLAGSAHADGLFSLKGFYLDGAALYSNRGEPRVVDVSQPFVTYDRLGLKVTESVTTQRVEWSNERWAGVVKLGYDIEPGKRWRVFLEAGHRSMPDTRNERDEEFAQLGVQLRPWGRR